MEVAAETNFLMNFLQNGDDFYSILHKEGAETPLSELTKAYSNHMRITHKIDKATFGEDFHPIKACGFGKIKKHSCQFCGNPHWNDNC